MTDQKLIAGIFNDFLGLYTGKIQTGIRPDGAPLQFG